MNKYPDNRTHLLILPNYSLTFQLTASGNWCIFDGIWRQIDHLVCKSSLPTFDKGRQATINIHPSIHYPEPLIPFRVMGGWRHPQPTLGRRGGTPWISHQFITGMTYRDRQTIQFRATDSPNFDNEQTETNDTSVRLLALSPLCQGVAFNKQRKKIGYPQCCVSFPLAIRHGIQYRFFLGHCIKVCYSSMGYTQNDTCGDPFCYPFGTLECVRPYNPPNVFLWFYFSYLMHSKTFALCSHLSSTSLTLLTSASHALWFFLLTFQLLLLNKSNLWNGVPPSPSWPWEPGCDIYNVCAHLFCYLAFIASFSYECPAITGF